MRNKPWKRHGDMWRKDGGKKIFTSRLLLDYRAFMSHVVKAPYKMLTSKNKYMII